MTILRLIAVATAAAVLPLTTAPAAHAAPPPGAGPDVEAMSVLNSDPGEGVLYGGKLYFRASTPAAGEELWVSDGTAAGTKLAVDLWPGTTGSFPEHLTVFNDRLYFSAAGLVQGVPYAGTEVWSTDGTAAGTRLVADVNPGAASSLPGELTVVGPRLYFVAIDPAHGRELWKTDGTEAGTVMTSDLIDGPESGLPTRLTPYKDRLVYSGNISPGVRKPWVTYPLTRGSARLDSASASVDLQPQSFTQVGDTLVYSAYASGLGEELWASGGQAGDSVLVRDINVGGQSSSPSDLTPYADKILFAASSEKMGRELWVTDGTSAGTKLVKDIEPEPYYGSYPEGLVVHDGEVFFGASTESEGAELWASRGTAASTRLVADSYRGPADGLRFSLEWTASAAGQLMYRGGDESGYEAWASDGTTAGTRMITDLAPGAKSSWPYPVGTVGNRVVFAAYVNGAYRLHAWTALGSTMTAKAKKKYPADLAKRRKIVVPLKVVSSQGRPLDGGIVTLRRKGKVVGTAKLVKGTARIRIKARLEAGRSHRLVATWPGSVDVTGSELRLSIKIARPKR